MFAALAVLIPEDIAIRVNKIAALKIVDGFNSLP